MTLIETEQSQTPLPSIANVDIAKVVLVLRSAGYPARRVAKGTGICRNRILRLTTALPSRVMYDEAQTIWHYAINQKDIKRERLKGCLK